MQWRNERTKHSLEGKRITGAERAVATTSRRVRPDELAEYANALRARRESTRGRPDRTRTANPCGKIYFLLGTLSGTKPGIKLGTVTLALNPDAYFLFMFGKPNTLIANSLGILSPSGTSTAKLNLPLGLPVSLAGTVLYHAYLVLDPSRLSFDFSSNAVPLTLVK